ncbi:MAG TPA: 2Fe-2S iron-sulfur cluster-binding protein [Chthonomonadaceae bacterium]|nr:2Fe-2S iron-sulfur cluster-binding protein [Chthonomonadaceae bacterium]
MPHDKDELSRDGGGLSRRQFLKGVGLVGAGSALAADLLAPETAEAEPKPLQEAPAGETLKKGFLPITLNVNGQAVNMQVEPRTTLLNALRNHADPPITGPKLICDQGACGGCTVLVDGKTAYGCMLLAVDMVGKQITTVEGLAQNGQLNPVQEAFVEKDALMCGFCTPGFVMSVHALLQSNPNPTLDDVKHACAGNVCRCGTYPRVFEAALAAAQKMQGRA